MSCCTDFIQGHGRITDIKPQIVKENNKQHIYFTGTYKNQLDRVSRWFYQVDLLEKILHGADECFHLLDDFFQRWLPAEVFENLQQLHHSVHAVESALHALCFGADLYRLARGKIVVYKDTENTQNSGKSKKIDYLKTLSRVCHIVSHFLASAKFLHDFKILSLLRVERFFRFTSMFSAAGFALLAISLIWERYHRKQNTPFLFELANYSGLVSEQVKFANAMEISFPLTYFVNKTASLAGIIHAYCAAKLGSPKDEETVQGSFEIENASNHSCSNDHHHHGG